MATFESRPKRPSSSPFAPAPDVEVKVFAVGERVCHDLYGLGTVIGLDSHAVTVDFGSEKIRIRPPYAKLDHL